MVSERRVALAAVFFGLSAFAICMLSLRGLLGSWQSADARMSETYGTYVAGEAPQRPCRTMRGREESDLCAQWVAATSAAESAGWARWNFWLALFTVLGLGATVWTSLMGARAADKTLQHIRSESVIELRGYLYHCRLRMKHVGADVWRLEARFKNSGHTPVTDVACGVRGYYRPYPLDRGDLPQFRERTTPAFESIPPGATVRSGHPVQISPVRIARLRAKDACVVAQIYLDYTIYTGERIREVRTRHIVVGDPAQRKGRLRRLAERDFA